LYIQTTTRCNFSCSHCLFGCTEKGSDMSRKTFIAATNLAAEYGQGIDIGGGEPTIHPLFWDFMGIALSHKSHCENIWLATNGSIKDIAIALAEMAKTGVISVRLSRDQFHDKIDNEVIKAFTRSENYQNRKEDDYRSMTTEYLSDRQLIDAGRARKNNLRGREDCVCDECFITPQGKIYSCGCKKESWGTVIKPNIPDNAMFNHCYKYKNNDNW